MLVGVISDTHIPKRASGIPRQVFEVFSGVEAILHAGDVSVRGPLDELRAIAPVHAVAGNVEDADLTATLPPELRLELGGMAIGIVHDSGPSAGRRGRLGHRFPGCRVVVFGHSHKPVIEDQDGLLLVNPGSACDPRTAKVPTVALLELADGQATARLVELTVRRA